MSAQPPVQLGRDEVEAADRKGEQDREVQADPGAHLTGQGLAQRIGRIGRGQQARRERQLQRQQSSGGGGGSQITIVQQGGSGGSGGGTGGGGSTGTQDPNKNCIQDQDTGQWICQQP